MVVAGELVVEVAGAVVLLVVVDAAAVVLVAGVEDVVVAGAVVVVGGGKKVRIAGITSAAMLSWPSGVGWNGARLSKVLGWAIL